MAYHHADADEDGDTSKNKNGINFAPLYVKLWSIKCESQLKTGNQKIYFGEKYYKTFAVTHALSFKKLYNQL